MAAPRQVMARGHVGDARSTRVRRRRSNVLKKSTSTVFIGLGWFLGNPLRSSQEGSPEGQLELLELDL